jgi:hypothetical protein
MSYMMYIVYNTIMLLISEATVLLLGDVNDCGEMVKP